MNKIYWVPLSPHTLLKSEYWSELNLIVYLKCIADWVRIFFTL